VKAGVRTAFPAEAVVIVLPPGLPVTGVTGVFAYTGTTVIGV
jgi:hypothetical protein